MQNDWILDVLADLKTYATANGLAALAEQLDDTKIVAAAEIASTASEAQERADATARAAGQAYGGFGRGE